MGRNIIEGRWSFQLVEEYDDTYYASFKDLESQARHELVSGRRHLFEAEMKEDRRTHGARHHEATPDDSGPQGSSDERPVRTTRTQGSHMKLQRTVETNASPAAVFAYLSDFTNTDEWDPGTVKTVKVSGDGGVGTQYHNTSKFMGRETELTYEVVDHQPNSLFALRGENSSLVAQDRMEIAPTGSGSRVTYTADFTFKGISKLVAPLLAPAFKKLGDDAEKGLREGLGKL